MDEPTSPYDLPPVRPRERVNVPPELVGTSVGLIVALRKLGDSYGPQGVAIVAATLCGGVLYRDGLPVHPPAEVDTAPEPDVEVWWLLACETCDAASGIPMPMPFENGGARRGWENEHLMAWPTHVLKTWEEARPPASPATILDDHQGGAR